MGKSHPMELRSRVIAFVEEGNGHREAARHLRVSPRFVNDMVILKRDSGGLLAKVQGNHAEGKLAPCNTWLRDRLATKGARMIKAGRREYVQVLRLLETFEMADLQVAIKNALRMGAIGFDAVKHLVLCQGGKRPPKLDPDVYPYLPRANVGTTSAASYMSLMRGRAA